MKRLFSFISVLIFLLSAVFSDQPVFNYSVGLHGGTLYVDDSGESFTYGTSLDFQVESSKKQFFLNAEYTGIASNLKNADFKLNNFLLSAGVATGLFRIDAGFFAGGIPSFLNVNISKVYFNLNEFSYIGGFSDFLFNFSDSVTMKLKLFVGSQKSETSNLYLIFGKLKSPIWGGAVISLNLPYNLIMSATYSTSKINLLSGNDSFLGNGFINCFNISFGKNFLIPTNILQPSQKTIHKIKTDIGFLYSDGKGTATTFTDTYNTVFYPFSYLYATGNADLFFISFDADYTLTKNQFKLLIDSSLFLNVYSRMYYLYKATYKKNLLYDGSIKRDSNSFDFSNGDCLLAMRIKLLYSPVFSSSINADFFLQKDFVLPLITTKTKVLFNDKSEEQIKSESSDFSTSLLRTALLSGLSLGITINF